MITIFGEPFPGMFNGLLRSALNTIVTTFRSSGPDMKPIVEDLSIGNWYIVVYLLDACVALANVDAHLFDRDTVGCLGDLALKYPSNHYGFDDASEKMNELREAVNEPPIPGN